VIASHPSVSVIIPALDEERSVGAVIKAIPRDIVGEVIVVDGGSQDATREVAHECGAWVVSEPLRGYGRACARGVSEAHGDVVVFIDADGASDPQDIRALVAPIAEGSADLVLGSRLGPGHSAPVPSAAMPFHQRAGNRLAALLIRVRHGVPVTDLSPFRAVRRRMLLALPIEDLTFGWPTEMIVRAARAGWRIDEVPVSCRPRSGGRSKVSGTLRGATLASAHILGAILGPGWIGGPKAAGSPKPGTPIPRAPVVVIMAKQPVPGMTKTRLCPPLTPGEAAELYEALLRDTIDMVSSLRGIGMAVAVSPMSAVGHMGRLVPPGARILAVEGADIGECLRGAMGLLFSDGFTRVLAVGSDGPTLPAEYIERAAALLDVNDVVVGPAEDGGYYLIGLRRPQPRLFEGIAWSTAHVAAQTLVRAAALGLTAARLPEWYDVDTPADLERLRAELATLPGATAPGTRAFLAHHSVFLVNGHRDR
jgi:rSAM/selenodomain-associated transferase 1